MGSMGVRGLRVVSGVLAAVALGAGSLEAQTVAEGHEDRVERILRSLAPSLRVEGRAVEYSTLGERMEVHGVPGVSVAVLEGGELVWASGYGVKDAGTGEAVTTETLFQAASISKPVAAMGMLTLVEEGHLDLDRDVGAYLTSWSIPAHDFSESVTLRRITTHTAGLTVHGFPGYRRADRVPSTAEVLSGEGNTPPVFVDIEPGSTHRYSGGGTTVMQQLLQDVTGRPFAEWMTEAVLRPAGMATSTYEQPLPEHLWDDAATAHFPDGSPIPGKWHVYPEQAAAGLWTTPTELLRLMADVKSSLDGGDGVLQPATVREMLTPGMNGQGIGFASGSGPDARFGHSGSNAGFRATVTAFQSRDGAVAIMTNSDAGTSLYQELQIAIAQEYGWPGLEPRTIPYADWSSARRRALEGSYRVDGRPIDVRIEIDGDDFRISGAQVPTSTLVPSAPDVLVDLLDGSRVQVVWEEDRVVELRTRGLRIVPIR